MRHRLLPLPRRGGFDAEGIGRPSCSGPAAAYAGWSGWGFRQGRLAAPFVILALVLSGPASAQPSEQHARTCATYAASWTEALSRFGRPGLSIGFLAQHDAFIARGCRAPRDVCPRSQAELDLANAMTIAAMNSRTAGSFAPFNCPG